MSNPEPRRGVTHVITIPGTSYVCRLSLNEAGETDESKGTIRYAKPIVIPPIKVDALLKSLSRTTVKGIGKRRVKAMPLLQTVAEYQALTTAKAA